MPIDIGYVGLESDDGVIVRVFYQRGYLPQTGETYMDAPLVDNTDPELGPTGYCFLVINTTGAPRRVTFSAGSDLVRDVRVPKGNPVTSGQARSRTAAQIAAAGITTRGDVANLELT